MNHDQLNAAVDRFLQWKLPEDFFPDCHVSIDRARAQYPGNWPVGTNLFTAEQARAMLQYVLAVPERGLRDFCAECGSLRYLIEKNEVTGHERQVVCPKCAAQPEAASGEDLAIYKAISANYPRDAQPEAKAAPVAMHPATADLVQRFAAALAEKLAAAERKYGYSDGWAASDWMDECRAKLVEHVAKGDPRDVAAYCAFLWHHGERTAHPAPEAGRIEALVQFAEWVIEQSREDLGDVDGGSIQDKLLELGIFKKVTVTEPCGENCRCAEYDDFPQECIRLVVATKDMPCR